ncbi:MAG: helix-turn-helix transcriptional regulator [Sulfitobacter sp.]
MIQPTQSPAQLRAMFGANLRKLSAAYTSISDLSRQLGINRTQFNRYLAGESFPRPDVLARICGFFKVDARVLLEPVDQISSTEDPISNSFLRDYVGPAARDVPVTHFPNGFYRFSRRSFVNHDTFVVGLVHVHREGTNTFLRGYEATEAMRIQDLPTDSSAREFRGIVMKQEDGISIIVSRKNAMTSSFNYLIRTASFENNFWVGYVTRTVPETNGGVRATRLVYESLGKGVALALPAARRSGFCSEADLPPFHRRHLRPEMLFS